MSEQSLRDRRILIVEDEYILAEDIRHELAGAGAVVAGMVSTVNEALALVEAEGELDAAILDVNLGGSPVFTVADALLSRGIPFLFTTGYDASAIPPRFNDILRCEKPVDSAKLVRSMRQIVKS